jgi:CubicO group peptidase (beta-lactamase class C family)
MPRVPPIPRIPGLPDPFRRVHVPRDLEAITTSAEENRAERDAVETVWEAATDLFRSGVHPALALCVRHRGEVILDRAIGFARGGGPHDGADAPGREPATPATPYCVFSASKAITAMAVHILHERGALSIEEPVAKYIPEYGTHGKDKITIAHVLAHRAGVASLPPDAYDLEHVEDRVRLVRFLTEAKPAHAPGKLLAYHAISGGFILGEVVQRITGQTMREVLADLILDPLHFRWGNYGVAAEDVERVGPSYVTGPPLLPPFSNIAKRVLGQSIDKVVAASNDPRFLTAIVPSGNVVTTANELSRFFEIFRQGGELDGVRVMKKETLKRALTEQSHLEFDFSLIFPTRFSYGLMLGAQYVSLFGRDTQEAFGHLGLINIMGWADPARELSAGLITSGKALLYPELPRFYNVMQTIASEFRKR